MLSSRREERKLRKKGNQSDINALLSAADGLREEFAAVQVSLIQGDIPSFNQKFSDLCGRYDSLRQRMATYIPQHEIDSIEHAVIIACDFLREDYSFDEASCDVDIERKRALMDKVKANIKARKNIYGEVAGGGAYLVILGVGLVILAGTALVASADIFTTFLVKTGIRNSLATSQLHKLEAANRAHAGPAKHSKLAHLPVSTLIRQSFFSLAQTRYAKTHPTVITQSDGQLAMREMLAWDNAIQVKNANIQRTPGRVALMRHERAREKAIKRAVMDLRSSSKYGYLTDVVKVVEQHGNDAMIMNGVTPYVTYGRSDGRSPLLLAVHYKHAAVVRALLKAPALDINRQDDWYWSCDSRRNDHFINTYNTPLTAALGKRQDDIVDELLASRKIDVSVTSRAQQTPLICAVRKSQKYIPDLLGFDATDVNAQDCDGRAAIHYACFRPQHDEMLSPNLMALFRAKDLNPDLTDKNLSGWTALMYAAEVGDRYVVQALLDIGANPAYTNPDGMNAATVAELNGHANIAKLIQSKYVTDVVISDPAPGMRR